MRFKYTDGNDKDFVGLCGKLDNFLNELVGGEENRAEYVQYNVLDDIYDAIVVYDGNIPVGCAGIKKYDSECAELKRVFIIEEYRGRGISKKLMTVIEDLAKKKGFSFIILESGEPLKAAMKLYSSIGYTIIDNYGQYKDMPDSICMKKAL